MSPKITMKIKDTICNSCFCDDQKFLHNVWNGHESQKICTSCVLFSKRQYFCPTCFSVPSEHSERAVICNRCFSLSHVECFPANDNCVGEPSVCSACIDPAKLVFTLKKLEVKGDSNHYEGIDLNAARLLLTATNIVYSSLVKATEESDYDAVIDTTKAVIGKKTAKLAVEHTMNHEKINHEPSLIDLVTDHIEDNSPKTLRETKRMESLLIGEGSSQGEHERVAMMIDLNKSYPENDATM